MHKLYNKVLEIPYEDSNKSIKPTFTGGSINKNEPNKLYLLLQDGQIFKYDISSKNLDSFANHSLKIKNIKSLPKNAPYADERGLLNMVFDERENSIDGYFIVYSRGFKEKEIELLGDNAKWFGKAMGVNDESKDNLMDHITVLSYIDKIGIETKLWEVLQPQFNHNGGGLVLDKLNPNILYWGLGDGGGRNDMHGNQMDNKIHVGYSQDPNVFYGKIWKINLNDGSLYHRDSLFDKPNTIKQIALGLRNPWRMNINPYNKNELVIADVGQDEWESIKVVPLNESINEPHNMGWKILEGSHDFSLTVKDYFNVKLEDIKKPVLEYKRDGKNTYAVIGGYFDPIIERYIFGDYSGKIFISDWPPSSDMKPIVLTSSLMKKGLIHSMAQDSFGNIYALMNNRKNKKNILYRLNIPFGFKKSHQLCSNINNGLFKFMEFFGLLNTDIKIIIEQAKDAIKNTKSKIRVDDKGKPVNCVMQIVILTKGYPDKNLEKYSVYDVGARGNDKAWNGSKDIARGKAYTALAFSSDENALSSRSVGILSQPGQPLYGISKSNRNEKKGIITFPGGIPLYKNGKLIGAIGVSGDTVDIDELIAKAAIKGFEAPKVIKADNVLNIEY